MALANKAEQRDELEDTLVSQLGIVDAPLTFIGLVRDQAGFDALFDEEGKNARR